MRHTFAAAVIALAALASPALALELTSPDVSDGGTLRIDQVADVFGCKGGNVSPELAWSGAPAGTKSFAVTMYDPDAPTGSGFWHWVVFDIPASATGLPRGAGSKGGALPAGAVADMGDAGIAGYVGACPPPGAPHRYVITVRALKVDHLGLDAHASGAMVGFMANASTLAEATITATYGQ